MNTELSRSTHLQDEMIKVSCFDINDDSDEEDDIDDLQILPPSTSFGFLLDVRILEHQMSKLSCDHTLLIFCHKRSKISIKCHVCLLQAKQKNEETLIDNQIVDDSAPKFDGVESDDLSLGELVIDIGVDDHDDQTSNNTSLDEIVEASELGEISASDLEDCQEENVLNAIDDDEEIDKLLMDSPENEKKQERVVINEGVNKKVEQESFKNLEEASRKVTEFFKDSGKENGKQMQMFLKLKDLKDLLPSVPGLPQFTSNKIKDGMNPLEHIPFYDEDLSLVEEEVPQPHPQPQPQLPNVVNINIVSSTRATPSQAFIRHSNQVGQVPHQYNQMLHRDVQQRQIFQSQGVSISPSGVSSSHVRQSSVSSPINGPTGGVRIQKVRVQRPTQMIQASPHLMPPSSQSTHSQAQIPVNNLQRMPPGGGLPMQQPQFYQQQNFGVHNPRFAEMMQPLKSNFASLQNDHRARAVMSRFSSPEQPLYYDPRLPQGWRREIQRAENGQCLVVVFDSQGRAYRNQEEIRSSFQSGIDPSKIDFTVFGKNM